MTLFCVCTHFLKAVASTCKLREIMHVHAITFLFCMHMHPFFDILGHGPGCFLALRFITGSNFCSSISKDQALQFRLHHSFVTFCLRNHPLTQSSKKAFVRGLSEHNPRFHFNKQIQKCRIISCVFHEIESHRAQLTPDNLASAV